MANEYSADVPKGFNVPKQVRLDSITGIQNEDTLKDLGAGNVLAFKYYEGLKIYCKDEKTEYVWREVIGSETGLLDDAFVYPNYNSVDGIDYSGKSFNFFEVIPNIQPPDGSETKLIEGANVTITGTGTTLDPYEISSSFETSQTYIEEGDNITITGTGVELDPYIINADLTDLGIVKTIDNEVIAPGQTLSIINNELTGKVLTTKEYVESIIPSSPDGSETKLDAGDNVTILGTGTILDPYIINSTTEDTPTYINAGDDIEVLGIGTIDNPYIINSTVDSKIVDEIVDGDTTHAPSGNSVFDALALKSYLSTGLIKNGLISINVDPTKYDISAGIGIITNYDDPEDPISTIVNFDAIIGHTPVYLTSSNITYIAINSSGAVVESATQFTSVQRRDLIILGAVVHSNLTTINVVNNISAPSNSIGNQLGDLIEAVGPLNITGNKYTANGVNLSLDKSAGSIFKFGVNFANDWKKPHELTQTSGTALTFRYRTQNGNEGSDITVLDPTKYDLANVITTVPNNKYTIQTVTMFQTGLTRIQYGQNYYDSLSEAQNAIFTRNFVVENNILMNGITRAYIILKKETTSLLNIVDAKIVDAQKFGGVASGGVALTLSNIIAALGYTPENIVNKQNSLTVDGTNTKYPTVDAINNEVVKLTVTAKQTIASTITATSNDSETVGIEMSSAFVNGAFTGVTNTAAKVAGGRFSIGNYSLNSKTNLGEKLLVKNEGTLGNTAGSYKYIADFQQANTTNINRFQITSYRRGAGSTFQGAGFRLQSAVDNSATDGSAAFIEIGATDPTSFGSAFLSFGTGGTDRLSIINSGKVLINKLTSTGEQLQVAGTGKFEDDLYAPNINSIDAGNIDWQALGDSITYGEGSTTGTTSYANIIQTKVGFKSLSKQAISGITVKPTVGRGELYTQVSAVTVGTELITVMVGVNDAIVNNTLGDLPTVLGKTYASLDKTLSFTEAFRYNIETLKINFPSAKIIIISPLKTTSAWTTSANLQKYIDAEIAICNYLSVPFIDANNLSGIYPTGTFTPDGLHPNDAGYALLADCVLKGIINPSTVKKVDISTIITDAIVNNEYYVAPSQNAVFDALALKANIDFPATFTGSAVSASLGFISGADFATGSTGTGLTGPNSGGIPYPSGISFVTNNPLTPGWTSNAPITQPYGKYTVYTVATLPSPPITGMGTYATVSDALAPTYLTTVVGGGAIVTPVFYNGVNWVAH